ncbi:MAG TPA: ester cyclase [Myxococcota bacterium]|nr:ester cyclase [Myxococcota bacterium]HRY92546.1 ester cyclase [Myxococcota bacterium]HSA23364.1 ester cyclase [Myxococcota bacterium]
MTRLSVVFTALACLALGACESKPCAQPDAASPEPPRAVSPAEAALTPALQAFNAVSLPRVAELFCEDHELVLPVAGQPPLRGRAGILSALQSVQLAFPDAQLRLRRVLDNGADWAAELSFSGTHQAEFLGVPASQKRIDFHFALLGQVREGRLARTHVVGNGLALLRQLKGDAEHLPPGPVVPERPELAVGPGPEAQVAAVRALFEAFDTGDVAALKALVTEDVSVLALGDGKLLSGSAELGEALLQERQAFQGGVRIERVFAAGDCAAALVVVEGKLIGDTGPYKASGRSFREAGLDVFRFSGGKIRTWNNYRNVLDVLTQLGLFPPPAPAPAPGGK